MLQNIIILSCLSSLAVIRAVTPQGETKPPGNIVYAPTNVKTEAQGDSALSVSWKNPDHQNTLHLDHFEVVSKEGSLASLSKWEKVIVPKEKDSTVLNGLDGNKIYHVRVAAVSDTGFRAYSDKQPISPHKAKRS